VNGVLASVIGAKVLLAFSTRITNPASDPDRGRVLMAEGLAAQTTDEAFESTTPAAVDMRKQNFAQLLGAKVEQGYKIESQGDTEAVLFTRGRRSWFGLFAGRGERVRQMISVDDKGAATTRKLSPNETTEFGRTQ
jgi:hypothetical protein